MKPFFYGALIGILGGLIGLGGAEFRLPILTFIFGFATSYAIIINLIVSWITVVFSLLFRWESWVVIEPYWSIIATLLCGSFLGASLGVSLATRINEKKLDMLVAILLGMLSIIMTIESVVHFDVLKLDYFVLIFLGLFAGIVIGLFSSMLGIAGGELIIPTITLLYGVDIKIAGTLSLMVSLPTIMIGLYRYRNKQSFTIVRPNIKFIALMGAGSIMGAFAGKSMLGLVSNSMLQIFLAIILSLSAIKLYKKAVA